MCNIIYEFLFKSKIEKDKFISKKKLEITIKKSISEASVETIMRVIDLYKDSTDENTIETVKWSKEELTNRRLNKIQAILNDE